VTVSTTLTDWLRTSAQRDALLSAWATGAEPLTSLCITEALALVAYASKQQKHIAIGHPGGRARMPLLAAVHLAALQLEGYPSPFRPTRRGPVVFVTRQFVRRDELLDLDAAQVPISPALRTVRMRHDGSVVPIAGGRARLLAPENKLIVVNRLPESPVASAAAVVIDGATEGVEFAESAIEWATLTEVPVCVFEDSARRRWPNDALTYSSGWAEVARHAKPDSDAFLMATRRGHAAVLSAGSQPGLARAAHLLADARGRGQALPTQLVELSTIWRRLDELVTPVADYDSYDGLSQLSPKAALLAELVDHQLLAGRTVDIALPSRTARDAVLQYLGRVGVLIPTDGSLQIRSLGDVERWWRTTPTLLASPPGFALRRRLTAGDIGAINVLCYDHEIRSLSRILGQNLDELLEPSSGISGLAPRGVAMTVDAPVTSPEVVIEMLPVEAGRTAGSSTRLVDFASQADAIILNALQASNGPIDLPDDAGSNGHEATGLGREPTIFVPLTLARYSDGVPLTLNISVRQSILRVTAGKVSRISVLDVRPSMLVADIEEPSTFDRLRSLLLETRRSPTRMFLAAWEQALTIAVRRCGSKRALSEAMSKRGSKVGAAAVAEWTEQDRIGPRDAGDIARIGLIAEHPVVAQNATVIAETMRQLRILHQSVGRAVVASVGGDSEGFNELETLLGPEAVTVANEATVYRVISVGDLINSNNRGRQFESNAQTEALRERT
jgi:hypothetical protein